MKKNTERSLITGVEDGRTSEEILNHIVTFPNEHHDFAGIYVCGWVNVSNLFEISCDLRHAIHCLCIMTGGFLDIGIHGWK